MTNRRATPTELQRLFERNGISRRQFIAGLAALGLSAGTIEALVGTNPEPARAAAPQAQYLVLIVLDGFCPDYIKLSSMPVLSSLAASGVTYDRAWVAQLETVTPTGHASLSTGNIPRHDGLIGFEWRDPTTGQEVLSGWPQGALSGELERVLREAGTSSIPLAVKAADPKAKVVSISSEKVYAADAMGGWAADYILYHRRVGNTLIPAAVPGHAPPASFLNLPNLRAQLPFKHFTDWDYLSTVMALAALREFQPRVLMVNFPGSDVYGHPYGGGATPIVMKQIVDGVDRNIGRIVQAYKSAGIFNQTLFVVTADHGMVPNNRTVDGAITKSVTTQAGGQYMFHTGGTAAYIYLRNSAAAPAVADAMARVPNVTGSYHLVSGNGQNYYVRSSRLSIDAALNDAHHYLLGTFVGPTAPDVVIPFRENTIGNKLANAHGDHGGLNWGAQHVPLVLSGPGVASRQVSHFPARLVDVAPTVMRLLGLPPPPMDGNVLADSLVDATADEVANQTSVISSLTVVQNAIVNQSKLNIAEDAKGKVAPPPSLPTRP